LSKYYLRFWFEHGGFCIWSINNQANEKYGYAINNKSLPISKDLLKEIDNLEEEYATYLNWNCPQNPSQWTKEQKTDFYDKANKVYLKLKEELGSDYEIVNEVSQCIE
jgi:hypothetical protein